MARDGRFVLEAGQLAKSCPAPIVPIGRMESRGKKEDVDVCGGTGMAGRPVGQRGWSLVLSEWTGREREAGLVVTGFGPP